MLISRPTPDSRITLVLLYASHIIHVLNLPFLVKQFLSTKMLPKLLPAIHFFFLPMKMLLLLPDYSKPSVVVHAYNPSTGKVEAVRNSKAVSLSHRASLETLWATCKVISKGGPNSTS